jgi:hypothetical protein
LRKLAILVPVFTFLALAQLASAQQGDIMIGGGTLLSSSSASGVGNFKPSEKGGAYINITGDVVTFKHRVGFGVETAWRASQADYPNDYQDMTYRPILTDFNAVFQPKITKKIGADLFGGIGVASTRFYVPQIVSCNIAQCVNYSSSDHFMEDVGGGLRYYFWHHVFVRPELHYYHIQNNYEFNSNNVFRVGGSIGYTIGND